MPTLIVHGTSDKDIPFTQSEQAHKLIAGSELMPIENGSHILALHERGVEIKQA